MPDRLLFDKSLSRGSSPWWNFAIRNRFRTLPRYKFSLLLLALLLTTGCKKSLSDHMKKGGEYYQSGRYQEALVEYRNATNLAPKSPEVKYELGRTYLALGNPAAALADFQGTIELKPDHLDAQLQLATIHLERVRQSCALDRTCAKDGSS